MNEPICLEMLKEVRRNLSAIKRDVLNLDKVIYALEHKLDIERIEQELKAQIGRTK